MPEGQAAISCARAQPILDERLHFRIDGVTKARANPLAYMAGNKDERDVDRLKVTGDDLSFQARPLREADAVLAPVRPSFHADSLTAASQYGLLYATVSKKLRHPSCALASAFQGLLPNGQCSVRELPTTGSWHLRHMNDIWVSTVAYAVRCGARAHVNRRRGHTRQIRNSSSVHNSTSQSHAPLPSQTIRDGNAMA